MTVIFISAGELSGDAHGARLCEALLAHDPSLKIVGFGGPKMNELFITTARKGMSKKEIIKLPFSGSLFRVKINLKGKSIKSFNSDMLNC